MRRIFEDREGEGILGETRTKILEHAMTLFGEQGFKKTSMQQIADACEISKGAIYLHFRSKTELVQSILEHRNDLLIAEMRAVTLRADLNPRQKLYEHFLHQLRDFKDSQSFTEMSLAEAGFTIDEHLMAIAEKIRHDLQQIQEECLGEVFGDPIKPFIVDLSVIITGVLNECYAVILMQGVPLEMEQVADFLLNLTDFAAQGMISQNKEPLFRPAMFKSRKQLEQQLHQSTMDKVRQVLDRMTELLEKQEGDEEQKGEAVATLELIRGEIDGEEPNKLLIQGLLANLREHRELLAARREIAAILNIKLV